MTIMNTRISYLYRDAHNYKVHNECVVSGELSDAQIAEILQCCDMNEYFIPRQVGLPEKRFQSYDPEADHCWFELDESSFEKTDAPSNVALNTDQLCKKFALAKGNWDDHAPDLKSKKYLIKPASSEEAGLFYALPAEQDVELGAIGHIRMDFGRRGTEFWHTWHPRGPEELNSPEFKAELQEVVDELRESVLKSYSAMTGYCHGHGGEIKGGLVQNYGYIVETNNYRYCLRCNPVQGDYHAYLSCFDKRVQQMNMAADENIHQKIRDWYTAKFPTDELGSKIRDISFHNLVESMNRGEDIYEALGVEDSIVRERVFDKTAKILHVDYDVIYYKWLYGDQSPNIELPEQEAGQQQDMTMGGM